MLHRIFFALIIVVLGGMPAPSYGQSAVSGVAVGTGVAGTALALYCAKHKIKCALVGGAITYAVTAHKSKTGESDCVSGYSKLFRVVGEVEYLEIRALRRYIILHGGINEKQFWLKIDDGEWFFSHMARFYVGKVWMVSSSVCNTTLDAAYRFPDAGHDAYSFDRSTIDLVNNDAQSTGGIVTVKELTQ